MAGLSLRYGHWIEHHEPYTWTGFTYWSCSECGFECGPGKDILYKTRFCPTCGAQMDTDRWDSHVETYADDIEGDYGDK